MSTQPDTAVDPTRTVPLCARCKHYADDVIDATGTLHFTRGPCCNHPLAPIDVVNGAPCWPCADARDPFASRADAPGCGPTGAWFEASDTTPKADT